VKLAERFSRQRLIRLCEMAFDLFESRSQCGCFDASLAKLPACVLICDTRFRTLSTFDGALVISQEEFPAPRFPVALRSSTVHVGPVGAVVNVHRWSRFSFRFPQ
jgi:hypothetical protein